MTVVRRAALAAVVLAAAVVTFLQPLGLGSAILRDVLGPPALDEARAQASDDRALVRGAAEDVLAAIDESGLVVVDPVGSFEHCGMSPRTGVFYEVRMDVRRPAADADDADDAEPPVDELEAAVVDAGWTGSRRTGLSLGDVRASVGVAVPMNTSTDAAITLRTGRCAVFPDGRAEDLRRADDEPLDAS